MFKSQLFTIFLDNIEWLGILQLLTSIFKLSRTVNQRIWNKVACVTHFKLCYHPFLVLRCFTICKISASVKNQNKKGEDQSKSRVYRGETLKVGANEFKGVSFRC